MPSYKLTYFSFKGRAEVSRLIFAQGGVEYEDHRIEKEEWPKLKPSTPTGTLPVLEVDGKQLFGSRPIQQFLAERFGLAGSNDLENAEIAGIMDVLGDLLLKMEASFWEKDEEKKKELQKKLMEEDIPRYLGILEGMCKKNNSTEGWIYGNKPTYADLAIYHYGEFIAQQVPDFTTNFPCIAKMRAAVEGLPKIAEWLKNRPQTAT